MSQAEVTIIVIINAAVGLIALVALVVTAVSTRRAAKSLQEIQDLTRRNLDANLQVGHQLNRSD